MFQRYSLLKSAMWDRPLNVEKEYAENGFDEDSEREKISDQNYFKLVKEGDKKSLEDLIERKAFLSGYSLGPYYHGTNANFTEFKNPPGFPPGFFLTTKKKIALSYSKSFSGGTPKVLEVYTRFSNPYLLEGVEEEEILPGIRISGNWKTVDPLRHFIEDLYEAGFDAAVKTDNFHSEILIFYSKQIKLADLTTYDDKGSLIPLSERFNPNTPDIRY